MSKNTNEYMRVASGISIFSAAIFVPVLVLGLLQLGAVQGVFVSPAIHLALTALIAVSGLCFWRDASRAFLVTGSARIFGIAFGLLVAALLFLDHGLFSEWSDIVRNAERAEWYARIGSMGLALIMFLAVGFAERSVSQSDRRRTTMVGIILLLIILFLSSFLVEGAVTFGIGAVASAGHWTPLGRFLQIATVTLLTVTAIRYLYGAFLIRSEIALAFATGAVLLVMAELTAALVQMPYDASFWVSHLWYATGYLAFVWGGYASRVTHHEDDLAVRS